MSRTLPPQQSKILHYFADAQDEGRQPSRAEVAEHFGYAFPSAVSKHVDALVRKGLLMAEQHSGYLSDITPNPGRFALKVRGDSMIDDGILDGDFAIIQHGGTVRDNQVAAVVVDGEATLKRVRFYEDRIELIPANPKYQPLVVHKALAASVEVVGPLMFVYRTIS